MSNSKWKCMKCGNTHFETDEIATTGTGFSKFFDIQNRSFTTVTCIKCKYTEIYKTETSGLDNILDFLADL